MDDDTEVVKFLANFPGNQSDIRVGKDGMRITLDISEVQMPNALPLLKWRECVMEVEVREA